MGEITEALRRAKLGDQAEPETEEPIPLEEPARPRYQAAPPPPPPNFDRTPERLERPAEPIERSFVPLEALDELEDLPEHGVVLPADRSPGWQARVVVIDGQGPAAESCRHIALRAKRELEDRGARSVAIVSSLRNEGKTTVACNLALALASLSSVRSVALVDLDLRKPSVASYLGIPCEVGIEEVLRGKRSLRSGVAVSIESPPLDVFPVAVAQREAHQLIAGLAFEALVRTLERHYEVVVFDTPPVLVVPDAVMALRHVSTAIAVARSGRSQRRAFEHMCELLPPGRLVGSILNEGQLPIRDRQYGYYGYGYGYGEKSGEAGAAERAASE